MIEGHEACMSMTIHFAKDWGIDLHNAINYGSSVIFYYNVYQYYHERVTCHNVLAHFDNHHTCRFV